MSELLRNLELHAKLSALTRETTSAHFLLKSMIERAFDRFSVFETPFIMNHKRQTAFNRRLNQ